MYDTTDNQMFPLDALLAPAALLHEHGGEVTRVELARPAVPCGRGPLGRSPSAGAQHAIAVRMSHLSAEVAVGFAG